MAMSCCSSAQASAQGTPISRALTLMVQRERPQKKSAVVPMRRVAWNLLQNQPRVVGGMMSRRA
jgi:hypothetical protein